MEARFLGVSDEVTTCECCGKKNLKRTVAISFDGGSPVYYGTDCAARTLGRKASVVKDQMKALSYAQKWLAAGRTRESIADWLYHHGFPASVRDGKLIIGSWANPVAEL